MIFSGASRQYPANLCKFDSFFCCIDVHSFAERGIQMVARSGRVSATLAYFLQLWSNSRPWLWTTFFGGFPFLSWGKWRTGMVDCWYHHLKCISPFRSGFFVLQKNVINAGFRHVMDVFQGAYIFFKRLNSVYQRGDRAAPGSGSRDVRGVRHSDHFTVFLWWERYSLV